MRKLDPMCSAEGSFWPTSGHPSVDWIGIEFRSIDGKGVVRIHCTFFDLAKWTLRKGWIDARYFTMYRWYDFVRFIRRITRNEQHRRKNQAAGRKDRKVAAVD